MSAKVVQATCPIWSEGHCAWCQTPSHTSFREDIGASLPCAVPGGPWRSDQPAPPKPGTELKRLLAAVGITANPTCTCNAMVARMDAWGATCGEHLETIVATMEQEARARGWKLPGQRFGMRALVRLAIWRATLQER